MINISSQELHIVKDILKMYVLECEVWAFGSRVTGKSKEYSDLDLVIIGTQKIERKTMMLLKEAFEESTLKFRVDVIDWNSTEQNFRKIIEERYEVI